MIGFANASSNLSGIFIPILAGWLAEFSWQSAFWVYGIGFFVLFVTTFFHPDHATQLQRQCGKTPI